MKSLVVAAGRLKSAQRWDIDFHLPPVGIRSFPKGTLAKVSDVADVVKTKRDPTKMPEESFNYVDISSIDVLAGVVLNPQELTGEEAPSRARKEICAYDIIISTCRPTRGAIAVIEEELHNEICSTGFSVIRPHDDVNPYYLHFALRLDSTLEQFRKWSTGSSYPAILDEDVAKTLLPVPPAEEQDRLAKILRSAAAVRDRALGAANSAWATTVAGVIGSMEGKVAVKPCACANSPVYSIDEINARKAALPSSLAGNSPVV